MSPRKGKPKERQKALFKRQHDFIFKKQTQFAPVTRDQIHGADYLLDQVDPYIKLLQDFNASRDPQKEFFKCVMFVGPPGTGKTYFARYIATTATGEENDIRFVSAREFPRSNPAEPWTIWDVKRLWTLLRKYAATGKAVVLFWDQFDGFLEEAGDEIDQLCIEIDGLSGRPNGILFVAATTADPKEEFDEQLMRAGRFNPTDIIEFQPPTRKGRANILRFYFSQKPNSGFDADVFAYLMHDNATPADIRGFVESAFERAILRAKNDKEGGKAIIEKRDFVFALINYLVGRPSASATEIGEEKLVKTAVHELGHAIVARKNKWPVRLISVITQKETLGKTFIDYGTPEDVWTFDNARDAIAVMYGGSAAENLAGYTKDEGARTDYEQATGVAKFFVYQLAGGTRTREAYGSINLGEFSITKSERMKTSVEDDVGSILKDGEQRAEKILRDIGKEKILAMAKVLAKERVLLGDEFEVLLVEQGIEVEPARIF